MSANIVASSIAATIPEKPVNGSVLQGTRSTPRTFFDFALIYFSVNKEVAATVSLCTPLRRETERA